MKEFSEDEHKVGEELMSALLAMELKAREAGHSLVSVLTKAAKDQWGIDIRPDDPDEPEADDAAPKEA